VANQFTRTGNDHDAGERNMKTWIEIELLREYNKKKKKNKVNAMILLYNKRHSWFKYIVAHLRSLLSSASFQKQFNKMPSDDIFRNDKEILLDANRQCYFSTRLLSFYISLHDVSLSIYYKEK
jgi:hypothetical protein